MKRFLPLWIGQVISALGSGLTGFGLGVWVYQATGSVSRFAFITLCSVLPGILLAPVAGVLIDRFDRRLVLAVSNLGSAVIVGSIALLLLTGRFEVWHLYGLLSVQSLFQALHLPGLMALTSALVGREQVGRASGMIELGDALARILAPSLAGVLLSSLGLESLLALDFASFLIGAAALVFVAPAAGRVAETAGRIQRGVFQEAREGWRFLAGQPGLLSLLGFFAAFNLVGGFIQVLLTPLVLSFAPPAAVGLVVSSAGVGILLGSLLASSWKGPQRRTRWILNLSLFQSLILMLGGARPSVLLIGAAVVAYAFCAPLVNSMSQSIWLLRTPREIQGRVFSLRRMAAWSTLPLAYGLAGPLADRVFEPLMRQGGALAPWLGGLIGSGPGRGIALFFVLLGLWSSVVLFLAYGYRPLRELDAIEGPGLPPTVGVTELEH